MSASSTVTVVTLCRLELVLRPVPMTVMPSSWSDGWLAFTRDIPFGYSYRISKKDTRCVADFMIEHQSECLSDGRRNYTIAGDSLVACRPEAVVALIEARGGVVPVG